MEPDNFLVIVFAASLKPADLKDLFSRVQTELSHVCTEPPLVIKSDVTALCLLIAAHDRLAISRALALAAAYDTRYLFVRVDKPFEATGLATAAMWMNRHL